MDKKMRVGALLIRNKKILLVTSKDASVYWSPGGGIEKDESHKDALTRELQEELSLECIHATYYKSISFFNAYTNKDVESFYYFVEYKGVPKSNNEISSFQWFSKEDIEKNPEKIGENLRVQVIYQLIKDNYI